MVLRLLNPADWARVTALHGLALHGEQQRVVKVEVNTDSPTRIEIVEDIDGTERRTFVGVVNGWEKIEIVAMPDAWLAFDTDGEVWFWTNDGQVTVSDQPDQESYTRLLGRRERSDQLEIMMRQQAANYERLLASQAAELQQWRETVGENADPATGEVADENGDGLDERGDGTEPATAGEPPVPAAGSDDSARPGNDVPA